VSTNNSLRHGNLVLIDFIAFMERATTPLSAGRSLFVDKSSSLLSM